MTYHAKVALSLKSHSGAQNSTTETLRSNRLNDQDWEDAVRAVREASVHYSNFDLGQLAEQGSKEYSRARASDVSQEEHALAMQETKFDRTMTQYFAEEMVIREAPLSSRLSGLFHSTVSFLVPLGLCYWAVQTWHAKEGWIDIPHITLGVGFAISVGSVFILLWWYLRHGNMGSWLPRQSAVGILASLAATFILLPFMIREVRISERQVLNSANETVNREIAKIISSTSTAKLQLENVKLADKNYSVILEPQSNGDAISFDTHGLPGHLRAEFGAESARVVWSRFVRKDVTQSLVSRGQIVVGHDGQMKFETIFGSFPIQSGLIENSLRGQSKVIALIDPTLNEVIRIYPMYSTPSIAAEGSR